MRILFFKAAPQPSADSLDAEKLPIDEKMRRILESHVEEAETDEDRERAEKDLRAFRSGLNS